VTGFVDCDELELTWFYSDQVHDGATARRLADGMLQALREIIEHCAQPGAGGCTPSDFPLAKLTREQVDRIAGDGRSVEDIYPLTPLQAGMLFHSLVDEDSVVTAVTEPPSSTRAYFRGRCLQRWAGSIAAANWDSLVFDLGSDPLRRVPMMEPLRGTAAHVDTLLEDCATPAELLAALES